MTHSVIRRLLPVAAASLVLLSACSGGGSDGSEAKAGATPSATPTAPPVDPEQVACKILTASDRTELAGAAVDDVVAASGADGSSQCRWQAESALIQVTTLPAKEWAKSLPDVVKQLESSTDVSSAADKKDLATAKKLLAGAATFTDAQACNAFTTLAELGGDGEGTRTTVTSIPITETESGISGQTCSGGELTSILYSVPGLKQTDAVDKTVSTILDRAQKRLAAKG
ncbi:hypothetical protein IFT73_16325 [Aeromicrobium sp. CFBP 8757]|uniref:hypothetical protein n=1 Tax=Aeromicrobium sp. CFBP 8757 TaxID=2775288 RepID=UPI001783F2B9|nr:hypothetical protein [Aeromicrobium sp. CFBP 8757]MBD8608423.1 hypothetical protein [Aeromicrobium sp. CFBP 8757]